MWPIIIYYLIKEPMYHISMWLIIIYYLIKEAMYLYSLEKQNDMLLWSNALGMTIFKVHQILPF
jgi:hypothetical protein